MILVNAAYLQVYCWTIFGNNIVYSGGNIIPGICSPQLLLKFLVTIVLAAIETVLIYLLISIYRTKYIVTGDELTIKATKLIGGSKRVRLDDIISAERTLIPFSIRLFGASLYGGHHYVPGLGGAFVTMTNFNDGVLLKTAHGNYIITPREPQKFIEDINAMKRKNYA